MNKIAQALAEVWEILKYPDTDDPDWIVQELRKSLEQNEVEQLLDNAGY